jgi:hypothetical protein
MSTINVDIVDYSSNSFQNVTVGGAPIKMRPLQYQLRVGTLVTLATNTAQYETSFGINNLINSTGNGNTAFGFQVLQYNTTGNSNVGVGSRALNFNSTGNGNTAVGDSALQTTNVGLGNSALGQNAGYYNTAGSGNVFVGSSSGFVNTTGNSNTYVGTGAGNSMTTGNGNIFVGSSAGYNHISGGNNVFVGNSSTGATNTASDSITLGNSSNNVLRCAVTSITSLSDVRDKEDVVELTAGLEFVNELNPVSFVWNDRDENGKHGVKDFGFIAQDLKATQEKHDMAETLGLVYEENPEKLEASYGKLIPILVKAIKELSSKVEALESKKK